MMLRRFRPRAATLAALAALALVPVVSSAQAPSGTAPGPPAPGAEAPAQGAASRAVTSADIVSKRTLTISLPQPGDYFIRLLASADAKPPAPLPIPFTDKTHTFNYDPASLGKQPRIAVDDAKTGNTTIIPPSGRLSQDGSTVELGRIDFDHVRQVKVTVTYDGKPVQVAQVSLAALDKLPRTKTIDPTSQGTASFDDVPSGRAKLTVVYGDKLTANQDVDITLDHPKEGLLITAPVSNKVPTLDVPAAGTAAPAPAPGPAAPIAAPPVNQPAPQGGGFGSLIGSVLGICVAGGIIYLLYRWSQSGGMAATLQKVGIETSGPAPAADTGTPWNPNAPPPPVVSDPTVCPFCGQKKDAGGNCACTLSGVGAAPTGAMSPAVPTQPRLVGTLGAYSGSIFPLTMNGSGVTLGREASNTIPLGNDTTVSRRHASIRSEGGSYIVTDEGSSNGVYVNGVRISGAQTLNPGDEVQIGNTRFRFEI